MIQMKNTYTKMCTAINTSVMKKQKQLAALVAMLLLLLLAPTMAAALDVSIADYDPQPAEAGKYLNVWFKVENPTSIISETGNVEYFLEVIPMDGLELSSNEESTKRIGRVEARGFETIQYRMLVKNDAFEGANQIKALVWEGDTASEKDLFIEVIEKDYKNVDIQVGDVESDPVRIKPDEDDIKIDVTLINLGDGKAQGVRAKLHNLPEGITPSDSYSDISLVGTIDEDAQQMATFYIDVDKYVTAYNYDAKLNVSYKYQPDLDEEEYITEEVELPLILSVKPFPLYEITDVKFNKDASMIAAGDTDVTMTLTIKNVGEEKGESVRVKIFKKTEQPFEFDDQSDFLAPILEPNETGQVTFEFDIDENAYMQKYLLDLEIKSVVGDEIITYKEKVPVEVKMPRANNPMSTAVYGVLALIVFAIALYVRRKNRQNKTMAPAKKVKKAHKGKSHLDKMIEEDKE